MNSFSDYFGRDDHIFQYVLSVVLTLSLLCINFMSCARIPKESVLLSEELTGMIKSARAAHLEMLNAYMAQRRAKADSFLVQKWIPDFMNEYVTESGVLWDLDTAKTNSAKGQIMLNFSEAASDEIFSRRTAIMDALDEIERTLKNALEAHYADMLMVNQALIAHLRSAAEVTATREELLQKLNIRPEEIIPFDELNFIFDKVVVFEENVEDLSALVDSAKGLIEGGK